MAINVKKLLSEALIELTNEKPPAKITVNDIIKRAGTGRQTFYNHFRDKNGMVFRIFLQTLKRERKIVQTQGYFAYLLSLYQKAQVKRNFFQQAYTMARPSHISCGQRKECPARRRYGHDTRCSACRPASSSFSPFARRIWNNAPQHGWCTVRRFPGFPAALCGGITLPECGRRVFAASFPKGS